MKSGDQSKHCRTGFTLIEIAAVIAVMGILAGAAVLSLAHTVSQRRFESVCQQLEEADRLVRSAARRSGQVQELIFDLDNHAVLWRTSTATLPSPVQAPPYAEDFKLTALLRLTDTDELVIRTREQCSDSGQVAIGYCAMGYSPSYSLELRRGKQRRWMIVSGLSGQTCGINDEQTQTIFKSLSSDAPGDAPSGEWRFDDAPPGSSDGIGDDPR